MTPTNVLSLTLDADGRSVPIRFPVRRVVNAGYVGRDREAVRAHIEELRHEGIPSPATVPVLFPLTADSVTTADEVEVLGGSTSGEVEYVLLMSEGEVFVGVGSDHTDRALERQSMAKAKQICKDVMSGRVWRYRELEDRWDDLVLRSWVRSPETGEEVLYQEGRLGTIYSAEDLIELVRSRIRDRQCEGLVIFSGTVPLLDGRFVASDLFRGELHDPRTGRCLVCSYRPVPLRYLHGAAE
jgi:hypothetical protein